MPRFFFHYREREEYSVDDQGIEFESVEDAYLNAYTGAVDLWGDLLRERRDPRRCSFEVTNDKGQLLFVFPFTEVLDVCRQPERVQIPFGEKPYPKMLQARSWAHKSFKEFQAELNVTRSVLKELRKLINSVNKLALD